MTEIIFCRPAGEALYLLEFIDKCLRIVGAPNEADT